MRPKVRSAVGGPAGICERMIYIFLPPAISVASSQGRRSLPRVGSGRTRQGGQYGTIDASSALKLIPESNKDARKGDNGKILVVGGSYLYHGAPIMTSLAAQRCRADLVYTAVPKSNVDVTRSWSPDLIVIPMADPKLTRGSVTKLLGMLPVGLDSAAIGMGMAVHERGALTNLVKSLTDMGVRLSLDASALIPEVLSTLSNTNSIVTPHAGEFERLFDMAPPPLSEMERRISMVKECAGAHGVTVLLKGRTDIISDGDITYLCKAGMPGMTTGGTGDVLSGVVASLLALCDRPVDAAAAAAQINGAAGELLAAEIGVHILASELTGAIPTVMRTFEKLQTRVMSLNLK